MNGLLVYGRAGGGTILANGSVDLIRVFRVCGGGAEWGGVNFSTQGFAQRLQQLVTLFFYNTGI